MPESDKTLYEMMDRRCIMRRHIQVFTRACVGLGGRLIRGDESGDFWRVEGSTWHGDAPEDWDESRVIPAWFWRTFTMEFECT